MTPVKRGDWGYIPFKLEAADEKYLTALKLTSPHQHTAILAADEELRLTYEELSVQLGWSINTFKTRLHRARAKVLKWRAEDAKKESIK